MIITTEHNTIRRACFAQFIGPWLIEPNWFANAARLWEQGVPFAEGEEIEREAAHDGATRLPGGVAVIELAGHLMKNGSAKMGGTSTLRARRQIREAVNDTNVRGLVIHADSPGGTVAGTAELADDIRAAALRKPVRGHIDDLGASAAYWALAGADRITINRTGEAGSIGAVSVLEDTSKAAEMAGVKVHVIGTGKFKRAGHPGTELTEEVLDDVRGRLDAVNNHFMDAVADGRDLTMDHVQSLADGRVFPAKEAYLKGLVDQVMTFEDSLGEFTEAILSDQGTPRRTAARVRLTR